jgi:hypothetical protein
MIVVIQTSATKILAEEEVSIQLLVMGIAVEVLELGLQKKTLNLIFNPMNEGLSITLISNNVGPAEERVAKILA